MNYTDQVPSTIRAGDKLTFTLSGSYLLPCRITARITLIGGSGGGGGGVYFEGRYNGSWGGVEGKGGKLTWEQTIEKASLGINVGKNGSAGAEVYLDYNVSPYQTVTASSGSAGTGSSLLQTEPP